MIKAKIVSFLLPLMLSLNGWAFDFSQINIAWQYDQSHAMRVQHRVVGGDLGNIVFLQLKSDSLSAYALQFFVQEGFKSEVQEKVSPTIDTLKAQQNTLMLRLQLPKVMQNLLVVQFSKGASELFYDINLSVGRLSFPSIYPVNDEGTPLLDHFVNRSGTAWLGSKAVHAIRYRESFERADPPMAEMKPLAPVADVDSSFLLREKPALEEGFFYVLRSDSNASSGVTVLRTPPYFPKYRQLNELVEPMLYIMSEQEQKAMLASKDIKQSFDAFWMNTYGVKARARNAIRKYFLLVEQVNALFTDFKPGWKTDRGMLYIAYGKPDEVYRSGSGEEWFYDSGEAFEFTIISSFFAPRTYTLRRNPGFEKQWYERIASIRRGNFR